MRLESIHIYPVKSLRRLDLGTSLVESRGLAGDRRWMVTDPAGGFLTQRVLPRMATVKAEPDGSGGLVLRAADHPDLVVPAPSATAIDVKVWKDEVQAVPAMDAAGDWLSAVLDRPVQLVYQAAACVRKIDPLYSKEGDEVSFADGYPVLLTNHASLKDLNRRLENPVPMNRFRPNLVFNGDDPWMEDKWVRIAVGNVYFRVAKPSGRCVVTTIDQDTGTSTGKDPLRTLSDFRLRDGKALFGVNLIPEAPGTVHMGDELRVVEARTG